ncbi:MAG: hypothetical protein ACRC6I_05535 [Paracoccaceae bacterium]
MPILIAIALLAALFVWANWGRDKATGALGSKLDPLWSRLTRRRKCRWVAEGASGETLRAFRCETCGVTAYSAQATGPQECKRGLGGGL